MKEKMKNAFVIVGYPSAGKKTAANILATQFDIPRIDMKGHTGEQVLTMFDRSAIIVGVERPADILFLKSQVHLIVLKIEADQRVRYTHCYSRFGYMQGLTFEQFSANETQLVETEKGKNLQECCAMADYVIVNNGSLEDLEKELQPFIEKVDRRKLR